MIEKIEFSNYKALRNTTLPLAPFTLLLGPNGSGKSSVLQAIQIVSQMVNNHLRRAVFGHNRHEVREPSRWAIPNVAEKEAPVVVALTVQDKYQVSRVEFEWQRQSNRAEIRVEERLKNGTTQGKARDSLFHFITRMRTFSLDPARIAQATPVNSEPMAADGYGLASLLDDIKDNFPERWDALLSEFRRWLPEYDYIQFTKPEPGKKAIALRTKRGGHQIPAEELSQGTLVALALLALAYQPNPPSLIALEEIDRGLHPRLLRHLQDALYRLSYPESCGETRPAIQVIATTHSPYLLDLYRDHPEEVVLAEKTGLEVQMRRLADIEHFGEILGESPLSDVWYSGILGGVAVKP